MSSSKSSEISRDEVELVLPWYVAGTLSADETARVEAYLAQSREFDAQIATLREDQREAINANEALHGSSLAARDRLMAEINSNSSMFLRLQRLAANFTKPVESFLQSLAPGRLGFAATLAALIVGVQAVMLAGLVMQRNDTGAQLAGVEAVTEGTAFLVKFRSDADFGDVTSFLSKLDAEIVSGPQEGELFKIRVGQTKVDQAARDVLHEKLSGRPDLVSLVLPSD